MLWRQGGKNEFFPKINFSELTCKPWKEGIHLTATKMGKKEHIIGRKMNQDTEIWESTFGDMQGVCSGLNTSSGDGGSDSRRVVSPYSWFCFWWFQLPVLNHSLTVFFLNYRYFEIYKERPHSHDFNNSMML